MSSPSVSSRLDKTNSFNLSLGKTFTKSFIIPLVHLQGKRQNMTGKEFNKGLE